MKPFPRELLFASLCLLAGAYCWTALCGTTPLWHLPEPRDVQLGGAFGEAYQRGAERLTQDPYRSAAYLRSDFSFETNRIFVNYSGDISGRFIEMASLLSPHGQMTPAALPEVLRDIGRYQKEDGHFGRDVDWSELLELESSNAKLLPIFWGNSRLLVGLVEAYQAFGRPDLLESAKRLGDFYTVTADRFLDPAREAEYRSTGTYAAGYVTDYFPGIEGLARLYLLTKDARYLGQAEHMAAFFRRFDTLPIDHSHGNLITHHALLLLHQITGKPEYLERPQRQWQRAVEGGFVWPLGGVGEKFRVSFERDEGCSESDWLRLNLRLWELTGETPFLEMAERLLWNHYPMNRTANGGYGHHNFVCDPDGPLLMKPEFTEAVWCCTFHGLLGLHTLKKYVVAGSERGVFINFPIAASASVRTGKGVWPVTVYVEEKPGVLSCQVKIPAPDASPELPDLFLRRPPWAERTTMSDAAGTKLQFTTENGYARVAARSLSKSELKATFEFSPRVEDRRLKRVELNSAAMTRYRGMTLFDGPHILLANTDHPRPTVVAVASSRGELRMRRSEDGSYQLLAVSNVDATEQDIATAAKQRAQLGLTPWKQASRDTGAAFVFDLIVIPENSRLARQIDF